MEMPKPSPGHERLKLLAGRWEGEETMYPSPWAPEGCVAQGVTVNRVALGGFAVIGDYEQRREGQVTFSGHLVWTYDPKKALYRLHWFDCMGSDPEEFTGGFDGDVLTVSHGGPGPNVRLTYQLGEPGRMRARMEMSPDGESWTALFDGVYERAAD